MKSDQKWGSQDKVFWAYVRSISQQLGYTDRRDAQVKVYPLEDVIDALHALDLFVDPVWVQGEPTPLGRDLLDYFEYRALNINGHFRENLMALEQASMLYQLMQQEVQPRCPQPLNKQKGDKKGPAYFTCMINMLIEKNIGDIGVDYNPGRLTTFTQGRLPVRTFARRVDGCVPSTINPIAFWEIKEYYYTTSFGSRVADGVYESLLDGMEAEEMRRESGIETEHLLFIDAYQTWWKDGKSYLCRIVDMLNMGYLDEVIVGREILEAVPRLVEGWKKKLAH